MVRSVLSATWLLACLPAQTRAVVPAIAEQLPGNAAVSLPLRWSQGTMVVSIDAALLPAALAGRTITGLRMRRPAFLGEPAYPAQQRTITVRAAFSSRASAQLSGTRSANWPTGTSATGLPIVAGPAVIAVQATTAPNAPQATGDEFLVIPFAAPLPVVTGNLLLEFEVQGAQFAVDSPWVDAVWSQGGVEQGYAVPVGNGTCTTQTQPLHLTWSASQAPTRGTSAVLTLAGAPVLAPCFVWVGLEPLQHPLGAGFLGFGASLSGLDPGLAGCSQWIPLDAQWGATTGAIGNATISFPLPVTLTTAGQKLGVQAAVLDPVRPGIPLDFANGVIMALDRTGLGNRCATMLIPGTGTQSPWAPDVGLMPVIVLEY